MADEVGVTDVGYVTVIEIRRPPANYFDYDLLRAIADACETRQRERTCRAIVLCAEGKHFCAGANFGSGSLQDDRDAEAARLYREGIRLFSVELPIVAAVQGAAVGGGLGLACAADFRVASSASRFHANFSALGFHHGFGLSVTLPRIVGPQRARDLLLTSRRIGGEEAFGLGLVDRLVEPGRERDGAIELAGMLASRAPLAVRAIKQTLGTNLASDVAAALEHELREQQRLWSTRDSQIGIAAGLAGETPVFCGE